MRGDRSRRLGADDDKGFVHILAAVSQRIGRVHAQRDETAAGFEAADDFFLKDVIGHGVLTLAAKMADEKFQRLHMGARLAVVVDRIEAKLFRGAASNKQRAGLRRRFRVLNHGAPSVIAGDFGEYFLPVADAQ